jgi:hypothetical protein
MKQHRDELDQFIQSQVNKILYFLHFIKSPILNLLKVLIFF